MHGHQPDNSCGVYVQMPAMDKRLKAHMRRKEMEGWKELFRLMIHFYLIAILPDYIVQKHMKDEEYVK